MRVTQQEMEASHRRIVEGAARLFRERGLRDTSVADAMSEAGLTHGGFYRHFGNKDELVVEALRAAFEGFSRPLELRQEVEPAATVAAEYKALYLSDEHVANAGRGCPMPAIGSDLAREAEPIRAEFAAGLERLIDALAHAKSGDARARRDAATREIAMLVGAVVLARAARGPVSAQVLEACRS